MLKIAVPSFYKEKVNDLFKQYGLDGKYRVNEVDDQLYFIFLPNQLSSFPHGSASLFDLLSEAISELESQHINITIIDELSYPKSIDS